MKSAQWNMCTMPSRNYATITEIPGEPTVTQVVNGPNDVNDHIPETGHQGKNRLGAKHDGHSPLHAGEEGVGTAHPAADGVSNSSSMKGGLDVCIRVEIDNRSKDGETEGYGMTSKLLVCGTLELLLTETQSLSYCLESLQPQPFERCGFSFLIWNTHNPVQNGLCTRVFGPLYNILTLRYPKSRIASNKSSLFYCAQLSRFIFKSETDGGPLRSDLKLRSEGIIGHTTVGTSWLKRWTWSWKATNTIGYLHIEI